MEVTTDTKEVLHEAMNALSSVCDGALREDEMGFNKADSHYGKMMAASDPSTWDETETWVVYEVARRYQVQLAGFGIDFHAIPVVESPETVGGRGWSDVRKDLYAEGKEREAAKKAAEEREARWAREHRIEHDVMGFLVIFPYDPNMVAAVKDIPGRRFESLRRLWVVPFQPQSAQALLAFAAEHRFTVTEKAQTELDRLASQPVVVTAPVRSLTLSGNVVTVKFDYDARLVSIVKEQTTGRRFDPATKAWNVPVTNINLNVLRDLVDYHGFTADAALQQRLFENTKVEPAAIEVKGLNGTPYVFQTESIQYALAHKKVFLAEEQGLGKTVEAIGVISTTEAYPAVIVCPASLKRNWEREVKKWLPGVSVVVLNGGSVTPVQGGVTILNYDILGKWMEALKELNPRVVVFDEFHFCKEGKSQRSQHALALASGAEYVLGLSGTPVMNRPRELAHPLRILGKLDEFGGFMAFMKRYTNAFHNGYGWDFSGAQNLVELNQKLREGGMFIRHLKVDVLTQLPPKVHTTMPVEMANYASYLEAERNLVDYVASQATEEAEFVASIAHLSETEQKQRKSARYTDAKYRASKAEQLVRFEALKQLVVREKMESVVAWIEDFLTSEEKLVVFADHIEVQEALIERLAAYAPAYILGGQDASVTEAQKTRFQEDAECRVIICSLKAASVGHTLTAASNVCLVELPWRPADIDQASDRVHRIGQTADSVNIWYLLAAGTIDEELPEVIDEKRKVVDAVTEGVEASDQSRVIAEVLQRVRARRS